MDVVTALSPFTKFFARNGRNAGACVNNKCLGLAMGAEVSRDVVVHEISRIAVERCRVQMHMHHVLSVH